jgi:uncharacterized protein YcsI (UPF0317 family)
VQLDRRDPSAVRAAIRAGRWKGTTLMITHAPGQMFVTDLRDDEQAIL